MYSHRQELLQQMALSATEAVATCSAHLMLSNGATGMVPVLAGSMAPMVNAAVQRSAEFHQPMAAATADSVVLVVRGSLRSIAPHTDGNSNSNNDA